MRCFKKWKFVGGLRFRILVELFQKTHARGPPSQEAGGGPGHWRGFQVLSGSKVPGIEDHWRKREVTAGAKQKT